ncbi:AAA family ATPase [Sinorhizobium americanum]|uniref:AAA domain-containing protein n=1 Tax=Sinorhizobium americanum TaxID=194963 RepID=A0A4R2BFT5_9HYPH|nr:AAA family ATPase [Sinorhizobium americanum]TCN25887.1 AAA domain-containing protein [Sinorhizobium americanum]
MNKATRIGIIRKAMLETPRRRYIIPGVLPVGTGFFYGDSGVGKTGLTIRTAVAIAAGLSWADRKVTQGSVLYVAGEDYQGVTERLAAAIEYLGLRPDDLPIAVMHCPEKGLVDGSARQEVANAAKALVTEAGTAMSLIVFDTLATCFGNDNQDDATAAGKFLKNAERLSQEFECAVLTVHHSGKSGSSKGMRGSSVFRANSDSCAVLSRNNGATIVSVEKARSEPDGSRFAFNIAGTDLEVAGGKISVQVITDLNAWSTAEKTTRDEDQARRNLTDAAVALTLLQGIAVNGTASLREWQEACFIHWKNKPSDGSRRTAFSNVRKKLTQEGKILSHGDVVSVSVTSDPANIVANTPTSGPVSVSVSTTPLLGGVHGRTNSRGPFSQKQNGRDLADEGSTSDGSIAKANAFVRGHGGETPGKGYSAGPNAVAHTGTEGR